MSGLIVGLDYDSYKATLVALPLDGSISKVRKETAQFRPKSRSGDDEAIAALANVHSEMLTALLNLRVRVCASGDQYQGEQTAVWVERGFGMSRRADFILGAYFGAIVAALVDLRVVWNPMDLREWKQIVTLTAGIGLVKDGTRGNGNAKKEVANEACRALLALGEIDASEWTPDELDAFGISFAGRDLNRKALVTA